jgi:predicted TIM-barrel fold metal-dependent hydrolase
MAARTDQDFPGQPARDRFGPLLDGTTIVDVHGHIGISHATGVRASPQTLAGAMDRYGVTATLVMPQPTDPKAMELHDEIAEMARRLPGRVFGIALLDPRVSEREYSERAERLLVAEGFVALKLHSFGHSVSAADDVCDKVFKAARRYRRPVMVHTGLGGPHTLPGTVQGVATRYEDVPIVLCHAGFGAFWEQAVQVAEHCDNVLLEPSWTPGFAIGLMLERLGADRVMFGSDHASNIPVELTKIATLKMSPKERTAILGGTAIRVFNLAVGPRPRVAS